MAPTIRVCRLAPLSLLVSLLVSTIAAAQVIQMRPGVQPRDPRQRQQTGTASISGRVTSAESGVPLRRVQVRVGGQELRGGRTTMTDADGKFTIGNLPAGRYNLSFTKAGYAATQYGQKRPNQPGQAIDLSDGQTFEKANASLMRGGVIAGRVFDDFGEPIVDARITVMQYRWTNGRRRLMNMGRVGQSSNDRGEYRVWGLGAGEYYVSAVVNDRPMFLENSSVVPESAEPASFAPTYYPGTAIVDEAQRVNVAAGQEVSGVDFNLVTTRTVRVSGTALTSDGKPMASAMVMMMARSMMEGGVMMPQGAQTDSNGAFTLPNVAPGEYVLQARPMGGMGMEGAAEVASIPIAVPGTEDIRNVMLVASRGVRVSGRVTFEGAPPADAPEQMNIFLSPASGEAPFVMTGPSNSRLSPERTFEVRGVIGKRTVTVGGLPAGWVLKAVRIGGNDILDTGYDFGKDDVSNVEVVVSSTTTTISGKVTADNKPVTDYVVVAFPTDEERWHAFSPRRFSSARPDQNGIYKLRNLPPGSYYVLALDAMPEEWGNPELFRSLKDRSKRVTLDEGASQSLDLTLQGMPVS